MLTCRLGGTDGLSNGEASPRRCPIVSKLEASVDMPRLVIYRWKQSCPSCPSFSTEVIKHTLPTLCTDVSVQGALSAQYIPKYLYTLYLFVELQLHVPLPIPSNPQPKSLICPQFDAMQLIQTCLPPKTRDTYHPPAPHAASKVSFDNNTKSRKTSARAATAPFQKASPT